MQKIASQIFESLKNYIDENPDLVKATLIAGGLGAAGGLMSPVSTDKNEPASSRFKKRLKNALIGAGALGTAGALLQNASNNISTAKLPQQPTPEETISKVVNKTTDTLTHPATLLTGAGLGALIGRRKGIPLIDSTGDAADTTHKAKLLAENIARTTKDDTKGIKTILGKNAKDSDAISAIKDWINLSKNKVGGRTDTSNMLANAFGLDLVNAKGAVKKDVIKELAKRMRAVGLSPSDVLTDAALEHLGKHKFTVSLPSSVNLPMNKKINTHLPSSIAIDFSPKYWGSSVLGHLNKNKKTYAMAAAVPALLGLGAKTVDYINE